MSNRAIVRTLLIDADDTLWENNIYYLESTGAVLDCLEEHGIDQKVAQGHLDRVEQLLIPTLGYGPPCYIAAIERTCRELLPGLRPEQMAKLLARVRQATRIVVEPPMVLRDAVPETLRTLRTSSQMVLVTKGLPEVQQPKIKASGLEPLFDDVHIVPEKHADTYCQLLATIGADPKRTWMIGNSPGSDINPAIEAGIGAIYVPHDSTWSAEMTSLTHPERVVTLDCFSDLVAYFEPQSR